MNYGKEEAKNPAETFGEYIFGDAAMKKYLTAKTYASLRKTIDEGEPIDPEICAEVAEAMKNWAMSFGATHYTHWFQPLTGTTAGKHEAFLDFCGKDGAFCFSSCIKFLLFFGSPFVFLTADEIAPDFCFLLPDVPPEKKRCRKSLSATFLKTENFYALFSSFFHPDYTVGIGFAPIRERRIFPFFADYHCR